MNFLCVTSAERKQLISALRERCRGKQFTEAPGHLWEASTASTQRPGRAPAPIPRTVPGWANFSSGYDNTGWKQQKGDRTYPGPRFERV